MLSDNSADLFTNVFDHSGAALLLALSFNTTAVDKADSQILSGALIGGGVGAIFGGGRGAVIGAIAGGLVGGLSKGSKKRRRW